MLRNLHTLTYLNNSLFFLKMLNNFIIYLKSIILKKYLNFINIFLKHILEV